MPAVTGGCRNTNVITKKVRSANATRNPSQPISAAQIAKAAQVISARLMPCQSGVFAFGSLATIVIAMSASESPIITMPYQIGKNAGPGPSSL